MGVAGEAKLLLADFTKTIFNADMPGDQNTLLMRADLRNVLEEVLEGTQIGTFAYINTRSKSL